MDMESDMGDADMGMGNRFQLTFKIHLSHKGFSSQNSWGEERPAKKDEGK